MHDTIDMTTIRSIRHSLRLLEREIGMVTEQDTSCCGVTSAQCHFMLEAATRPGANLSEIADALSLDASTVSRMADALVSAGLVKRDTAADNRRKVAIMLSGTGTAKVEAIDELCDASWRRLLESIPADKRASVVESTKLLAEAMKTMRLGSSEPCCRLGGLKRTGAAQ